MNWRNARARETYLREGEARGRKKDLEDFFFEKEESVSEKG